MLYKEYLTQERKIELFLGLDLYKEDLGIPRQVVTCWILLIPGTWFSLVWLWDVKVKMFRTSGWGWYSSLLLLRIIILIGLYLYLLPLLYFSLPQFSLQCLFFFFLTDCYCTGLNGRLCLRQCMGNVYVVFCNVFWIAYNK